MQQGGRHLRHSIKHRGKTFDENVWWLPDHGIWGAYLDVPPSHKNSTRFWNAYGVEDPSSTIRPLTISVESCVPHFGCERRIAAAFAKIDDSQIVLVHSGKIGDGGRFSSGFLTSLGKPLARLYDGRAQPRQVVVLGVLGSSSLQKDVAWFVHKAREHKDNQRRQRLSLAQDAEDLAAFEERAGEPDLVFEEVLKDLKQSGRI